MYVVDHMVNTLRNAGYENVYPNQLPAKVNEGIAVRFVTSVTTAWYMDGRKAEDVTYQVICRRRSGLESTSLATELMEYMGNRIDGCKKFLLIGNVADLHPQQLQLPESGYYETMIQLVAEIVS